MMTTTSSSFYRLALRQGGRSARSGGRPVRCLLQQRAFSAVAPPVRVVSRSSLARHVRDHPSLIKKPPPPPKIKDSSETPWPLPLRIAGYVAVTLFVPYCGAHIIASSPTVRDWLEGDRPDLEDDCKYGKKVVAFVRTYWGESEGLPYADHLQMEEAEHSGEKSDIEDWTVLQADPTHVEREAQAQIEALKHHPVPLRATLVPPESVGTEYGLNGKDDSTAWSGKVDGTVAANRSKLVGALGGAGWDGAKRDVTQVDDSSSGDSNAGLAAVDFDDDIDTVASTSTDGIRTDAEMNAFESSGYQIASDTDEVSHLKRLTTTWSAWHHESAWSGSSEQTPQSTASSTSSPSSSRSASSHSGADALQIATLEHQIAQLQSDLKDPMCTRDIDDMERELKEARNELWRVKGGWGGKIRSALRL